MKKMKKRILKQIIAFSLIVQLVMMTGGDNFTQKVFGEEKSTEENIIENTEGRELQNANFDIEKEKKISEEEHQIKDDQEVVENENTTSAADMSEEDVPTIAYCTYISGIGWQEEMKDGETAGTTGKAKSIEALKIRTILPESIEGNIEYAVYIKDEGWQDKVTNDIVVGTTGKGKNIEAMKAKLTGDMAQKYDIYYRVHSSEFGWLGWAKNGEYAGSVGYARNIEAIEMKLCAKDIGEKPSQEQKSYMSENNMGNVTYQAHMQDIGWMNKVTDGVEAGIPDGNNDLQAIRIFLAEDIKEYGEIKGDVLYQTHVENVGWQNEVKGGELAGTVGENKQIEAIKIRLSDQIEEKYNIYYRVNIEKKGWLDWTSNGKEAGSVGLGLAIRGIQIKIYLKDQEDGPKVGNRAFLTQENYADIVYQAHVQNVGWKNQVADGENAGTEGKGLGIEGLRVKYIGGGVTGDVICQAHVSGLGWQTEVSNGEICGSVGKNIRIEAVKIKLAGELEEKYDIYYRTHVANFGWMSWNKNGEVAGSTGYGCAMEGIEIKLYPKNSVDAPKIGLSALTRESIPSAEGQVHISKDGWQEARNITETLGTTGENKGIEAIALSIKTQEGQYSGGIEYQAHVQDIGWQNWNGNGSIAGTTGQGKHIEAMRIRLTGEVDKYADIYYRMHVSNFGWLGWAKNGQSAGTSGYAYKVEAIQIKIVPKNTSAPGDTKNAFKMAISKPSIGSEMQMRANLYGSSTPYLILVNRSSHKVGVFRGWQGNWNNIQYWDCSDGAPTTPTVEGTFRVGSRGYYFDSGSARCYWYTQFKGNYLFHSVLYSKYTGSLMDGRLGMALSHGCVRLDINNAKWIYDNIPSGTTVVVYH